MTILLMGLTCVFAFRQKSETFEKKCTFELKIELDIGFQAYLQLEITEPCFPSVVVYPESFLKSIHGIEIFASLYE